VLGLDAQVLAHHRRGGVGLRGAGCLEPGHGGRSLASGAVGAAGAGSIRKARPRGLGKRGVRLRGCISRIRERVGMM
jgi:hypothetical protein